MKRLLINGESTDYEIRQEGEFYRVTLSGETFSFRSRGCVGSYLYLEDDKQRMHRLLISPDRKDFLVEGELYRVTPKDFTRSRKKKERAGDMVSPMPGKVLKLMVQEGDSIKAGDSLLVLEAMKMEHTIKATHDGIIRKIHYQEGSPVEGGVDLVDIEKGEEHAQ